MHATAPAWFWKVPTAQGSQASAPSNGLMKPGSQGVQGVMPPGPYSPGAQTPDAVVAPGLVIAGTDSRQMSGLTSNVYRFVPVRAGPGDLARFHGTNERIGVENYAEVIRFFHRLISVSAIEGK